jgi:flagellar basal-body rod protein FlgB
VRHARTARARKQDAMDLFTIPFFQVLRTRLSWLEARNQTLAENIANADTPHFRPHDLQKLDFAHLLADARQGVTMRVTDSHHLPGAAKRDAGPFKTIDAPDREATPDGNAVVLEDQMIKLSETQMSHETAISLYRKGLEMLRIAVRNG